jgi:hypothetical protein
VRKIGAFLLAGAVLLGACGGDSSANPKEALTEALDNLGRRDAFSLTFTLQSDVDSLVAASKGDLAPEDAQKILDSSLTIAGNQAEDPADARALVVANVAGLDGAVEIRVVGGTLYARADAKGLAETFGQDPAQLDAFAQQASAGGLDFLAAAVNGDWISLSGLDQLSEQFGAPATPNPADVKALKAFADALEANSSVTSEGSEDAGEHLVVTVPLRAAYEHFLDLAGKLSAGVPLAELPPVSEVPDENLQIDVWVADGQVTQVEFDLVQLGRFEGSDMPKGIERLALRVAVEDFSGGVEEPPGATEVDLAQLMNMFMGGLSGGGGTVPTDICKELQGALQGAPQEVIDQLELQYGSQCPEVFN